MIDFRLYLITDGYDASTAARVDAALDALPAGAAAVQLRAKTLEGAALYRAACRLREIVFGRALLFVNDRFDVALAAGADGVHLPAQGLPPRAARRGLAQARGALAIGCSTHSLAEAQMAAGGGADFVVFGPVWETPGKGPALGVKALAEVVHALPVPVFALGGVDAARARTGIEAGARLACIGAVLGAADPAEGIRALWAASR